MMLFWLMLGLASRRFLPAWARGAAVGLAVLDATLNLMTESRGSVFTLPLVVVFYFAFVPGRLRSAAVLAVIAAAFAPVVRPVLARLRNRPAGISPRLSRAQWISASSSPCSRASPAFLVAILDERWTPSARTVRTAAIALVAVAAARAARRGGRDHAVEPGRVGVAQLQVRGEPSGAASHFGGLGPPGTTSGASA